MIRSTLILLFTLGFAYGSSLSIQQDPFAYSGEYTDSESGLQYLKARYYDPDLKRFNKRDTVVLMNRYSYVDGNPIVEVDPTGHMPVDWEGLLGPIIAAFQETEGIPDLIEENVEAPPRVQRPMINIDPDRVENAQHEAIERGFDALNRQREFSLLTESDRQRMAGHLNSFFPISEYFADEDLLSLRPIRREDAALWREISDNYGARLYQERIRAAQLQMSGRIMYQFNDEYSRIFYDRLSIYHRELFDPNNHPEIFNP